MIKWLINLFKKKEVLFCKECRWCVTGKPGNGITDNPKWAFAKCISPSNFEKPEKLEDHHLFLVGDGDLNLSELELELELEPKRKSKYCEYARAYSYYCGKKGRWFEQKK